LKTLQLTVNTIFFVIIPSYIFLVSLSSSRKGKKTNSHHRAEGALQARSASTVLWSKCVVVCGQAVGNAPALSTGCPCSNAHVP